MVYPFEHRDEKILASLMKDIMQIYKMMVLSVIPQMRGGVTDADQLIRLGKLKSITYHLLK